MSKAQSYRRSPDERFRWNLEKAESEVCAPERAIVALRENSAFDPRTCACGEPAHGCTCAVVTEPPQQFSIRVEKLTQDGIIGADLDLTIWAADMMTASRRARRLLGRMWHGWMFLAVPVQA